LYLYQALSFIAKLRKEGKHFGAPKNSHLQEVEAMKEEERKLFCESLE